MTRLSGKVALITGGGTGIGRACALRFASEGAKVAIVGRRKELLAKTQREIQVSGGEAFAMECDVTESGQVNHAVRTVAEKFGALNVVVNNAGVMKPGTAEETSDADWNWILSVNLTGTFLVSRAALAPMRCIGRRLDHQHQLGLWAGGYAQARGICGVQGRRDSADQGDGARSCARKDSRELHLPGLSGNGDCPGTVRRLTRSRSSQASPRFADSGGTCGHAGGNRGACGLPGVRRIGLGYGRGAADRWRSIGGMKGQLDKGSARRRRQKNSKPGLAEVRRLLRESVAGRLFGFELRSLGRGRAILSLLVRPRHKQIHGVVHGGILAAIADTAVRNGRLPHGAAPRASGHY